MIPPNRCSSLVLPVLAASLLSLTAGPASAQAYGGDGFVQRLVQFTPGVESVDALAVGNLTSDTRPDVAMLVSDGRIAVNVAAGDRGKYEYVTIFGGFDDIAVVSEAGVDELMATDGTGLYRILWNGLFFTVQGVGSALGGRSIRAVATDTSVPGLAVIESNGTTVKMLERNGGVWSLSESFTVSGQAYAVDCLDFEDDGDLEQVILSDTGFDIRGAVVAPTITTNVPADPVGALLEVVSGDTTGGGRDLAVLSFTLGENAYIHVWNTDHYEWHPFGSARVGSMGLIDILENDGQEDLVLGLDTDASLLYLEHQDVTEPEDWIFASSPSQWVDLALIVDSCEEPTSGPPLGGGDLDNDGDADLVFVSNCLYLSMLPGETIDEDLLRTQVDDLALPTLPVDGSQRYFRYVVQVTPPAGATMLHCSVHHQPSASGLVNPVPLGSQSKPVTGSPMLLQILVPAPPTTVGEVFQVLIRPTGAGTWYPSTVRYWSEDTGVASATRGIYPWTTLIHDPGGTVGRPRIDPEGP